MNKNAWIGIVVAAVAVIAIVVIALFAGRDDGTTNGENGNRTTIKVGVILPLTGSAAVWGKNAQMGIELARDRIVGKDKEKFLVLFV